MESTAFKKINRLAGRAVHDFGLIADKSRILVGLSGGKDSLALLYWLAKKRGRIPVHYELGAAHLHLSPEPDPRLMDWLDGLGLDFIRVEPAAALSENERGRCYVCAMLRRKRLFDLAAEYGAPLLALGHHQDDVIETFLMNIIYSGETSAIVPRQDLFENRLAIIRPFYFVPERLTRELAETLGFPVVPSLCPACGVSSRRRIKDLVARLGGENPQSRGNIFNAMFNLRPDYLPKLPAPKAPRE